MKWNIVITGVPGHDEKDEEFANMIGLDSVSVLKENESILVNSEEVCLRANNRELFPVQFL